MPCRLESRGRSLRVVIPDGSETLASLIQSVLKDSGIDLNSFTGRVEGLLEFEGRPPCELALDSEDGVIKLLCVDCGSERLGDEALPEFRRVAGERPAGGYVELMELSRAAVGLDAELRPEALVKAAVRLSDALPTNREAGSGGGAGGASNRLGREGVEGGAVVGRSVGGVDEGSTTSAQPPEELLTVDSEVFLANVVINSKVIDVSSDGGRLGDFIAKAADLSRRFRGCVYRLAITLRDGEIVNAFFYGGTPCALFRHNAGTAGVAVLKEGVKKYLESIPREGVKHILLCEVRFPPVVEGIRRLCRGVEGGAKPSSRGSGEGGKGRGGVGGILSKLFRRF